MRRGARALFRGIWTYGWKVIEFQSFSMNKKITFTYILHVAMTHKYTRNIELKLDLKVNGNDFSFNLYLICDFFIHFLHVLKDF